VVARIVRRLHPVKTEGLTQVQNVYPLAEFLRSTDPLFRPVDVTTAPDGTMYITDMYRGIIQESQWSGPGTYLRQRIDQYGLDKITKHGRIWRLTYEGMGRRTEAPRMLAETPAQLVAHLSDANGWWRDTAQQLLVLKQDKSVVPALVQIARTSKDELARIHAMWTLEGLGSADASLVRELLEDTSPQIRIQAVRVSETLYKAGNKSFAGDYKRLAKDADTDVVIQAVMTLNTLSVADAKTSIKSAMDGNPAKGVQLVANTILNPPNTAPAFGLDSIGAVPPTPEEVAMLDKGKDIYGQLCFACHGEDGRGTPIPGSGGMMAPPLAASPRVLGHQDYVIKTLLHGLSGPVGGVTYPDVMVPMGQNPDEWVAAVGSYVRNAFGNRGSLIVPAEVAHVRKTTAARKTPWPIPELEASLPRVLVRDAGWKVSASHNAATASNALSIQPWSSGQPQQPNMWFQVELSQPAMLAEIQFESGVVAPENVLAVPGAPTRTAIGGRGAAPGAPAPPPALPGYPRGYQVQVSADGVKWSAPVAQGQGTGVSTRIAFSPVSAKFVRITQTATTENAPPWSIQRLRLYEAGAK
jgi:mono/diheme cytochrome c family protein